MLKKGKVPVPSSKARQDRSTAKPTLITALVLEHQNVETLFCHLASDCCFSFANAERAEQIILFAPLEEEPAPAEKFPPPLSRIFGGAGHAFGRSWRRRRGREALSQAQRQLQLRLGNIDFAKEVLSVVLGELGFFSKR